MTKEKKRAPGGCDAGALEFVAANEAINVFECTQNLRAIQAKTIARRHRIAPSHAYVIASLAFGEVRA